MKVVVYGAGYFGKNYIKTLLNMKDVQLVGVVESNKVTANSIASEFSPIPVFTERPINLDYDGAVIVTPPEFHVPLALEECKLGHYVMLEKPFGTGVEEFLKLRKYKNTVMCGLIYMYNEGIEGLKRVVSVNPILHAFSRRTNNGPIRTWQSALWDLGAHDISIFNYLMGEDPFSVSLDGTEDWSIIGLTYPALEVIIYVSWHGGPKIRQVELVMGNSGDRIIFDDMTHHQKYSPMELMLRDFASGNWNKSKAGYNTGLGVLTVLEALQKQAR